MKKFLTILILITLSGCSLTPPFGAGTKDEISKAKLTEKFNLATEIKSKYELKDSSLVKTEIKNAELDKYKGEPKDEVKITLGDSLTEFTPVITLSRWNEVDFKLKPKDLELVASKDKVLSFDKDKIKFDTPKISFEMYEATTTDGYKYIWYLNEAPLTNKVEFQIESSDLDFFYQPPLNAENTDPNLTCTETQCKDADGNIVSERPENVVGSYAVYHSTKGGMNDINGKDYKTGQAFMIYRPHIIDASGAETWGILHVENGIYSVEIPQEFLDKAVYPIKSNDTFGYTTVGSTQLSIAGSSGSSSYLRGYKYSSGGAATLDSLHAAFKTDSADTSIDIGAMLFRKDSDGANSHGKISGIKRVNIDLPATAAFYDFTASSESIALDNYLLSITSDGYDIESGSVFCVYNTVATTTIYVIGGGATSIDTLLATDPLNNAGSTSTRHYSIYATYTPSGGGATSTPASNIILFE